MPEPRFSADDWGLSPSVNEAVLELARAGEVRSVSLFANLPYLHEGLAELRHTGVELAAHLNFTLGRPLSAGVESLRARNGCFHSFGAFAARGLLGLVRAEHVLLEASAQLEALGRVAEIRSVNGHQHVHLLPWLAGPISAAARAAGIGKVRLMEDAGHLPSRLATRWAAGSYARLWPEAETERLLYLWPTGRWTSEELERKLGGAAGRALLIHPASRDDFAALEFKDGLRADRVREFERLRSLRP